MHDRLEYDHYSRVSDYMHKVSLQWKKKHERKAKASSSSFSDFSPSMLVSLCQMPLSAGGGVVTTTHSSTACPVTFSAANPIVSTAPFVPPVDVTSVELCRKQHHVESLREKARMFAAFEDIWASRSVVSSAAAACDSTCSAACCPSSRSTCGSDCDLDCACGCFFDSLGCDFVFVGPSVA